MADNKVKQVVTAFLGKVNSLTTSGSNAFVHYDMELNDQQLPALNITIGPVELVRESPTTQDWILHLNTELYVKAETSYWETLLLMQKEVHYALRAAYTLGLSFVHNVVAVGSQTGVEVNAESATTVARYVLEWEIHFRAGLNDIST